MTAQPDEHTQISRDHDPAPQAGCAREGMRAAAIVAIRKVADNLEAMGVDASTGTIPTLRAAADTLSASPPPPVAEREWQPLLMEASLMLQKLGAGNFEEGCELLAKIAEQEEKS